MNLLRSSFMKRFRGEESKYSDSPSSPRRRSSFMKKKRPSSPSSKSEDTSSETTDSEAPWRVEHFLIHGAPKESDWWENRAALEEDSAPEEAKNEGVIAKQFRNLGLETFLLVQQAWREPSLSAASTRTPSPSFALRREMAKHMDRRRFDLPKKVPLSDLVQVYNQIWYGDESD